MEPALFEEMVRVEERHWWFTGRLLVLDALVARYALPPARRLVEPGCGTGVNLAHFRRRGFDVCGFDTAEVAVRTCQDRGLDVRQAAFEGEIPFDAASFDVLLLPDVLEHVEDDALALGRAVELLRPEGTVIVTVPAGPEMWSRHDDLHHHRRRYRRDDFVALLRSAGLRLELVSPYNAFLFPLAWAQRRVVERLRPSRRPADARELLSMPPPAVNTVLRWIFGGERRLLGRVPLPFGLSLVAVARRPATT